MASTNKTPQLGLNQWAAGDPVLREDFNADNAKIDALGAKKTCVAGTYTVGNTLPQIIDFGFRPKFVIISGYAASGCRGSALLFPTTGFSQDSTISVINRDSISITSTGFQISTSSWYAVVGATYQYIAFA